MVTFSTKEHLKIAAVITAKKILTVTMVDMFHVGNVGSTRERSTTINVTRMSTLLQVPPLVHLQADSVTRSATRIKIAKRVVIMNVINVIQSTEPITSISVFHQIPRMKSDFAE
mmetsp:Transcript_24812/g.53537  ORF Transcript_24812/g.53537 Transcript_24812/m.53537 type:complete len:114 (+) Transcript_24812:240-581(+)